MSLYFIKPVVWNEGGYVRPGGAKFTSGYPAEHGFGHEEWNNSTLLDLIDNGVPKHIFHTEGLGNQDLDKAAGNIFVFMIASHQGKQFLVSVAGKSTAFFGDAHRKERLRLISQVPKWSEFFEDAWSVETVKSAYDGDRAEFKRNWQDEQHWFATWTCPADLYVRMNQPLEIDPMPLTGRKRFIGMYGSYQEIDRTTALHILDRIPDDEDPKTVSNLKAACGSSSVDIDRDIQNRQARKSIKGTTRRALIDARLGQGQFRSQLNEKWGNSCAVTGCSVPELLRASHIQPWSVSDDRERLDVSNGLLLSAHLDALFDAGLITFQNNGRIVASPFLVDDGLPKIDISGKLRDSPGVGAETKQYLEYHRNKIFRTSSQDS